VFWNIIPTWICGRCVCQVHGWFVPVYVYVEALQQVHIKIKCSLMLEEHEASLSILLALRSSAEYFIFHIALVRQCFKELLSGSLQPYTWTRIPVWVTVCPHSDYQLEVTWGCALLPTKYALLQGIKQLLYSALYEIILAFVNFYNRNFIAIT